MNKFFQSIASLSANINEKTTALFTHSERWDNPPIIKVALSAELIDTEDSSQRSWRVKVTNKEQQAITLTKLIIFGEGYLVGGSFHSIASKDNLLKSNILLASNEQYEFIFETKFYELDVGECELYCHIKAEDEGKITHEWKSRLF